jgi:hypothetical protein
MKTIKQIADEIGVSKQAVFYRIKRPPLSNTLQSLTTKIDGVLMVEFDGEILIKQAFFENTVKGFGDKEPSKEYRSFDGSFDGEIIRLLQDNVALLQEQLRVKDGQLAEKDKLLAAAHEALRAEQLLHADSKKMLMLPAPEDTPLVHRESESVQSGAWGIFSRIFGRKQI